MEFVSRWTGTIVATQRVDTAKLTTPTVNTALVNISTVCQAIQDISLVAETLEAAGGVDARVVTGSVKGALVNILAGPLIGQQLVALFAAALETAHRVPAHMVTPPVVQATLVDVFAGLAVRLQGEAHGAAAAHSSHCVMAGAVTAAIIHSTRLIG